MLSGAPFATKTCLADAQPCEGLICDLNFITFKIETGRALFWTFAAIESYVDSSSFLGAELSIFTLLPGRSVRNTL